MIERRRPLPEFNQFSIEPKMVEILEELILTHRPRRVLELGCGISTLVIAYALEVNGEGTVDALESEENFVKQARNWTQEHKLDGVANIYHSPIKNEVVEWDGMVHPWYDVSVLTGAPEFDFVFVDGPPGSLCSMSRWPALHLLHPWLTEDVKILVDDANRAHERVMLDHWMETDAKLRRTDFKTHRGAALLEYPRDEERSAHGDAEHSEAAVTPA